MPHDTPPMLERCIAELELESRRLEVVLVPSPVEFWPTEQRRRVVCERNPSWYRELCRQHPANRTRPRQATPWRRWPRSSMMNNCASKAV